METLREELLGGLGDADLVLRMLLRLAIAALLGGLLGFERQHEGKSAGVRTHMLVSLGCALFTLLPMQIGANLDNVGRVIQGIAAGIGFLGAGTILKQSELHEIKGLTTAACIWLTAAVGVAVGAGRIGLALFSVILALFILYVLGQLEYRFKSKNHHHADEGPNAHDHPAAGQEPRS